jgi:hypothetical protein
MLVGVGLVAVVVLACRVAGGHGPSGSAVTFVTGPTGELGMSRVGTIVAAPSLLPGPEANGAGGAAVVRNQTGRTLEVRMRAVPSFPDLDRLLLVRVQIGNASSFVAALGDLRAWSARPFRLRSGEERRLALRAWLPASVGAGYQGRMEQIAIELQGTPVAA